MTNTIYKSTWLAAALLTVLCLALPSYQWATLSAVPLVQLLAGASALALSICKITFYPIAVDNWRSQRPVLAIVFFATASIALFFSVSATKNLIQDSAITKQHGQTVNSYAHQQAVNTVNNINNAIGLLNDAMRRDIEAGYRARAIEQQEKLAGLMAQRSVAIAEVKNLSQARPSGTQSTFLQNLSLGTTKNSIQLSGATGAAIALHLGCVLSILALSQRRAPQPPPQSEINTTQRSRADKKRRKKEEQIEMWAAAPKTPTLAELTIDQRHLYQAIKNGDHGATPVLRNIINDRVIKGGHKRVSPVFERLVQDGILERKGRAYILTEGQ
ncbi:hypothetical protein [Gilvimarinus japonicus]|uniref:MarR family transcriptional regulator n=1 Tax=Gilvimarinus japonicus TaxID=1796469 RepID=A0ABV7HUF6_9GAMM